MERIRTAFVLGVRYVYLTRFSWLAGIVLLGTPPVCLSVAPKLLANLFVLDQPIQLFHVSWITFWGAATVMETMRVTTLNADSRFDDYRAAARRFREAWGREKWEASRTWYRRYDGWATFLFGLIAALGVWFVMVDACASSIVRDPTEAWRSAAAEPTRKAIREHAWTYAYRGLALSSLIWLTLSALAIFLHDLSNRRWLAGYQPPLTSLYRRLQAILGPGYFHEDEQGKRIRLAPGHFSVLCYTLTFFVWYAVNYAAATGTRPMPTETSPYPALFYGLLSLLLLVYLLPGMAFFLDRYRVPTALTPLLAMMIFYQGFDTDHYYQLNPEPVREQSRPAPRITEVLDGWRLPPDRDGKRTLVVVDASGGGIQASAWSAQVLTGLHEEYGDAFSRSIAMISSVSGGSVGSMFYLANRGEVNRPVTANETVLTPEAIQRIRELSRSSGLEATTWGVAYADAMRAAFPPLVDPKIDRGWAIERLWRQRLAESIAPYMADWRLTDIQRACRQYQLPVPVFNATVVESGQRLLISPVIGPPAQAGTPNGDARCLAYEWMREFPESHPYVATAARLSATFPYVSPAARSDSDAGRVATHHVVDGAYVDNEGVVTSVDWLSRMLEHYQTQRQPDQRPFDRVLLVRIQAFPQDADEHGEVKGHHGWRAALAGPLDAMLQVRRASQTERGDLEVSLLTQAARARTRARSERFKNDIQRLEEEVASLRKTRAIRERLANGLDDDSPNQNNDQNNNRDEGRNQSRDENARGFPSDSTSVAEARRSSETDDRIRRNLELIRDMRRRTQYLDRLTVEAVTIDFQSPETTSIPLSWKLTERQKRNIDVAWREVADGRHPRDPLRVIDRFFHRAARRLAADPQPMVRTASPRTPTETR